MVGNVSNAALDAAIESTLKQMTEDQRDHFKIIMAALLPCYTDDTNHATILVGKSDILGHTALHHILNINSTDINAAQLVDSALQQVNTVVMTDAPPREMFS